PSPVRWVSLQGIFLVYDISSERSYQHIMKWASDVDEVGVGSEPLQGHGALPVRGVGWRWPAVWGMGSRGLCQCAQWICSGGQWAARSADCRWHVAHAVGCRRRARPACESSEQQGTRGWRVGSGRGCRAQISPMGTVGPVAMSRVERLVCIGCLVTRWEQLRHSPRG
uniref:RAB15, member RAS oncogene family n=1 Tax=Terrapene triunguis TaxID=2587831 RepID=A0A674J8L3_9SAUR